MDTIFMNSENSKTSEPHASVFTDKLDLREYEKMLLYATLGLTHGKTWRTDIIKTYLKYHSQHEMINLNHQMDHNLH